MYPVKIHGTAWKYYILWRTIIGWGFYCYLSRLDLLMTWVIILVGNKFVHQRTVLGQAVFPPSWYKPHVIWWCLMIPLPVSYHLPQRGILLLLISQICKFWLFFGRWWVHWVIHNSWTQLTGVNCDNVSMQWFSWNFWFLPLVVIWKFAQRWWNESTYIVG